MAGTSSILNYDVQQMKGTRGPKNEQDDKPGLCSGALGAVDVVGAVLAAAVCVASATFGRRPLSAVTFGTLAILMKRSDMLKRNFYKNSFLRLAKCSLHFS